MKAISNVTVPKPQVILAHPGTQYAPHLARELSSHGLLHRFWTGFALAKNGLIGKFLNLVPGGTKRCLGIRLLEIPSCKLITKPLLDWQARNAVRFLEGETVYFERNRRFQEAIPDREILTADIVVGFDTSSWLLAGRVKKLKRVFVLDQSIGHPAVKERIFAELRARFPAWSATAPKKIPELMEVESVEHDLADVIVAPSGFVKETLVSEGVEAAKIRVIPFGTDLQVFKPPVKRVGGQNGIPVVFLFVGGLTARKGLPVLLAAWKQLALIEAELWLVGSGEIPFRESVGLPSSIKVLGTKSRIEVASLMQGSDVFVFPSFFEGLAQVQIEALATGLPVIGTHESGASDVIKSGHNGLIVPAGDVDALANAIQSLALDHQLRLQMQDAAVQRRVDLSWTVYGDRWAFLLDSLR
jgi:starch synthase